MFQFPETSLLYSRVRSERNQSNSGTTSGAGTEAGRPASGAPASGSGSLNPVSTPSDRDSFSRWRDRQYYGPRRWFQTSREESGWDKDAPGITSESNDRIFHVTLMRLIV